MTTPRRTTVAVVAAGLGKPSSTRLLADRLADATLAQLADDTHQVDVRVIELRDLATEIAHHMVAGFPGPALREALETVTGADALIAVTPVFSASYSGLFKSFFDVIEPDALRGKPVLLGATGGTARHSLALDHALRPLFAYLGALTVPTAVFAASEDWGSGDTQTTELPVRVNRAAAELARLLGTASPVPTPAEGSANSADPLEDVVPFAQQLAALGVR